MKQAFKLTYARQSDNGATIEYFVSSLAAQARYEALESRGYIVQLIKVEYFNNNYCEVL